MGVDPYSGPPKSLEAKLEIWNYLNSAGVVVDAVRCAKLGLDRGICGALMGPSVYSIQSPHTQYIGDVARDSAEPFMTYGESGSRGILSSI